MTDRILYYDNFFKYVCISHNENDDTCHYDIWDDYVDFFYDEKIDVKIHVKQRPYYISFGSQSDLNELFLYEKLVLPMYKKLIS